MYVQFLFGPNIVIREHIDLKFLDVRVFYFLFNCSLVSFNHRATHNESKPRKFIYLKYLFLEFLIQQIARMIRVLTIKAL